MRFRSLWCRSRSPCPAASAAAPKPVPDSAAKPSADPTDFPDPARPATSPTRAPIPTSDTDGCATTWPATISHQEELPTRQAEEEGWPLMKQLPLRLSSIANGSGQSVGNPTANPAITGSTHRHVFDPPLKYTVISVGGVVLLLCAMCIYRKWKLNKTIRSLPSDHPLSVKWTKRFGKQLKSEYPKVRDSLRDALQSGTDSAAKRLANQNVSGEERIS